MLLSVIFISCNHQTVFSEYKPLPAIEGWNADSAICFSFPVPDTTNMYDVIISVRHTQQYPYQNMWLFVSDSPFVASMTNDSCCQKQTTDTIEFYLADDRGRWLGNGYGNIREMPVLYQHGITFDDNDTISLYIQHAMRDDLLRGVERIGVQVMKSEE